jgi:DNA-3-methyladenine glycosylase I
LEGTQAPGLSGKTILDKRDAYRKVLYGFDISKVANMISLEIDQIMAIMDLKEKKDMVVRHRGKLESVIQNAKQISTIPERQQEQEYTSFSADYLWSFVNDKPILNNWSCLQDIPSNPARKVKQCPRR